MTRRQLDFLELLLAICFGLLCAAIAYLIWEAL